MNIDRKRDQLRTAVARALTSALACDLEDPALDAVELHDVVAAADGGFTALFATARYELIDDLQRRLRDAAPIFNRALADGLTRKRVPRLSYFVVPAGSRSDFFDAQLDAHE